MSRLPVNFILKYYKVILQLMRNAYRTCGAVNELGAKNNIFLKFKTSADAPLWMQYWFYSIYYNYLLNNNINYREPVTRTAHRGPPEKSDHLK